MYIDIQGYSVARGPKLLSIQNYVIELMTWKIIYTYRERCKTGPAHNRCWYWSPFTSKDAWMRFSKFWNTYPKVSTLTAWISWRITFGASSDRTILYIYTGWFFYSLYIYIYTTALYYWPNTTGWHSLRLQVTSLQKIIFFTDFLLLSRHSIKDGHRKHSNRIQRYFHTFFIVAPCIS